MQAAAFYACEVQVHLPPSCKFTGNHHSNGVFLLGGCLDYSLSAAGVWWYTPFCAEAVYYTPYKKQRPLYYTAAISELSFI